MSWDPHTKCLNQANRCLNPYGVCVSTAQPLPSQCTSGCKACLYCCIDDFCAPNYECPMSGGGIFFIVVVSLVGVSFVYAMFRYYKKHYAQPQNAQQQQQDYARISHMLSQRQEWQPQQSTQSHEQAYAYGQIGVQQQQQQQQQQQPQQNQYAQHFSNQNQGYAPPPYERPPPNYMQYDVLQQQQQNHGTAQRFESPPQNQNAPAVSATNLENEFNAFDNSYTQKMSVERSASLWKNAQSPLHASFGNEQPDGVVQDALKNDEHQQQTELQHEEVKHADSDTAQANSQGSAERGE